MKRDANSNTKYGAKDYAKPNDLIFIKKTMKIITKNVKRNLKNASDIILF